MPELRTTGVPGRHLLSAALHVSQCFSREPQAITTVRQAMHHLPSDGIFSATNLLAGEQILLTAGVVAQTRGKVFLNSPVPPTVELLLIRYLESANPPWLGAATKDGAIDVTYIPEDEARNLASVLGSDPDRRDALLLALGQRFDNEYRHRIGLAAEYAVVAACRERLAEAGRPELAAKVLHVSQVSDQLGYDVRTPTLSGPTRRLEVKADPGSSGTIHFFLSRNEWRVGSSDSSWALVVCRPSRDTGDFHLQGWVDSTTLQPHVPIDRAGGRWSSVELTLPLTILSRGLPDALN